MRIRRAAIDDAPAIAILTGQLGYPVDADEQARRLSLVLASERDAVFVAVDDDDRPVGWTHIQQRLMLEGSDQALIAGLVVDEEHRSAGLGLDLLAAAEALGRGARHAIGARPVAGRARAGASVLHARGLRAREDEPRLRQADRAETAGGQDRSILYDRRRSGARSSLCRSSTP